MQVIDGNKDDNALLGFLNYDKIKTGKMRKQSEIWQQKRGCRALTLPIVLKPIIRAQAMTWRLSTTRQPAKNGLTKVRRKAVMGYARNGGSLAASSNKVDYPAANSEYLLTLARSSQSITAKIGNYSYSAVSDFDLAVSDSEYVYVCLWATRGTEVKFSNISFTSNEWANA